MSLLHTFDSLKQIDIPVPPMLEAALGYAGESRIIEVRQKLVRSRPGMTYEVTSASNGIEVKYLDGIAYRALVGHRAMREHLDGVVSFILDRQERVLFANRQEVLSGSLLMVMMNYSAYWPMDDLIRAGRIATRGTVDDMVAFLDDVAAIATGGTL